MTIPIRGHVGSAAAGAVILGALVGAAVLGFTAHAATSPTKVTVIEREYSVAPSQRSPKAGMTTFVVENRGKVAHQFEIRGPGVAGKRIAGLIRPGAAKSLTVKIQSGKYTLFCPLHYSLGMKTTITVAGSASSGGGGGGGGWG